MKSPLEILQAKIHGERVCDIAWQLARAIFSEKSCMLLPSTQLRLHAARCYECSRGTA